MSPETPSEILSSLPLLVATPPRWAAVAAKELPTFLADHAVCEQQAALSALNLVHLNTKRIKYFTLHGVTCPLLRVVKAAGVTLAHAHAGPVC